MPKEREKLHWEININIATREIIPQTVGIVKSEVILVLKNNILTIEPVAEVV